MLYGIGDDWGIKVKVNAGFVFNEGVNRVIRKLVDGELYEVVGVFQIYVIIWQYDIVEVKGQQIVFF